MTGSSRDAMVTIEERMREVEEMLRDMEAKGVVRSKVGPDGRTLWARMPGVKLVPAGKDPQQAGYRIERQ